MVKLLESVGTSARGFPIRPGTRDALALAFDAAKPRAAPRKRLGTVRPNAGLAIAYRRKLMAVVREMADSVEYWVRACYRQNEPTSVENSGKILQAMDATPAAELQATINRLSRRWQKNINAAAPDLAKWFAQSQYTRSDAQLRSILRKAGISVRFQWRMTKPMREVFTATTAENVGLIKSIPQQYLNEVQGLVMRSVQRGRDLEYLVKELRQRYDITERRAKLIARDQSNKATSSMQRIRQTELGIEEGIWMHSHAAREPRPTHLANDGKRFNIATGWFDPDPKVRRRIWPGELINCLCTWRPVVKGFS